MIDRMVAGNFECPEVYIRRSALYMAAKQYVAARVDALRAIELSEHPEELGPGTERQVREG